MNSAAMWRGVDAALERLAELSVTGLLHGTVLAAITALVCATLLRRARPALLAALWTVVLIKFLAPLGPELPVSLSGLLEALLTGSVGADVGIDTLTRSGPRSAPALSAGEMLWLAAQLALVAGYAAVVLWRLRRHVQAHRALLRWARAGAEGDAMLRAALARAGARIGLGHLPELRVRDDASSPQIAGVLRPVLVVPAWLLAQRERLDAALLHELAHLRRRDPWVRCLQVLAGSLLWAWPVVHWVNRRIDVHREAACDQWALDGGPLDGAGYARMLVAFARRQVEGPAPATMALLGTRKQIEHRVGVLLHGPRRPRVGYASALVLTLWALISLGTTKAAAAEGGADECVITADMVAELLAHFPEADRDGDGVLTREEMCAHRARLEQALGGDVSESDVAAAGYARLMTSAGRSSEIDGESLSFRENWDPAGWPDCAACSCSMASDVGGVSTAVSFDNTICTNEDK